VVSRLPQHNQQRRRQGGRLGARRPRRRPPAATAHVSLHRLGVLTCETDDTLVRGAEYFWHLNFQLPTR